MEAFPLNLAAIGWLSPDYLIDTFGTIGVIAVVFAESCFAFFLPGDSLLVAAGFLASQGKISTPLPLLCLGITLAAIAGNQVGYLFGRRVGPALFTRRNSRLFRQEHLEKTHAYFEKNGPKTIVIARFVPIVRTFACVIAGVAKMDYRLFLTYNIVGAVLWGTGVTVIGWGLGKWLGEAIDIDKYLLPFIAVVILLSFIPFFIEIYKAKKDKTNTPIIEEVGEVFETAYDEAKDEFKK